MLVESNLPPSPTSTTAASTFASAKAANARTVIYSKNDGYDALSEGLKMPSATLRSACIRLKISARESSSRFIWTLSPKFTKCGDVNMPVFNPCARKMRSSIAQTEPLPFVPATCMTGYFRCGFPNASANFAILSSENFDPALRRSQTKSSADWKSEISFATVG